MEVSMLTFEGVLQAFSCLGRTFSLAFVTNLPKDKKDIILTYIERGLEAKIILIASEKDSLYQFESETTYLY